MNIPQDSHKKMLSAYQLLQGDVLSIRTFENIRVLLKGIHPEIDKKLQTCSDALHKLQKLQAGDVITLSAEALPEETESQKKRKKLILLFTYSIKDLKSEIKRVEKEFTHQSGVKSWGRVMGFAKGPLAIITIVAVGIVILKLMQVEIVVKNVGCQPIQSALPFTINIPGIVLPNKTIPPSGEMTVKLPPITITVDATNKSNITLHMSGLHYNFTLNNTNTNLLFDDMLLSGKSSILDLGRKKQHILVIQCS